MLFLQNVQYLIPAASRGLVACRRALALHASAMAGIFVPFGLQAEMDHKPRPGRSEGSGHMDPHWMTTGGMGDGHEHHHSHMDMDHTGHKEKEYDEDHK